MAAVKRDWYGKILGVIRAGVRHVWDAEKHTVTAVENGVWIPVTITEAGKDRTNVNRRVWVFLSFEEAIKLSGQISTAAVDALRAREEA